MAHLPLQLLLIAAALLACDRLPRTYGYPILCVLVGALQYLQTILASTVYVPLAGGVLVSPGSVALFGASVAAVLLVYLRHDVEKTRALIAGVVASNLMLTAVAWLTLQQLRTDATNLLQVDPALFQVQPRVFLAGTSVLVFDSLFIVVAYEGLGARTSLGRPLRALLAMAGTLYVDALGFSVLAFGGTELFAPILRSQLVGKSIAAAFYGAMLLAYVRLAADLPDRPTADPFEIFTWRRRYELERAAREEADRANVAKSAFLARMSHELRTPLNAVIGFSTRLLKEKDGPLMPRQRTFLQRIDANGRTLLALLNDILDLSKIEAERMEVQLEPVHLRPMIEQLAEQLAGNLPPDGTVALEVHVDEGLDPVRSDPLRLQQVLTNLVGNAIKFTSAGSVTLRVRTEGATPVALDVTDTGIGIPTDKLDQIFEPFSQADESTVRTFGGTGLGLSISSRLCRLMGHRLTVESQEGVGSTFTVHFRPFSQVGGARPRATR
jgi:signal transduction histidine kinase